MMGINNNELNSSSDTKSKLRDDKHQVAISNIISSIIEDGYCQESTKSEKRLIFLLA